MLIRDLIEETKTALLSNKVRTSLTMLGIIIGIASVIAMLAIGTGAKNSIQSSIQGLGANLLTIYPGATQQNTRGVVSSGRGAAETLKDDDVPVIEGLDNVAAVSPEVSKRFQIVASNGNNTNTTVIGGESSYADVHNLELAEGSFIDETIGEESYGRTAVVGATAASDLFGDDDPIGQKIRIGQTQFTVIGLLVSKGGTGAGPDDSIFVPLSTMQTILSGQTYLSTISVSVNDEKNMDQVEADITSALTAKHNVAEADFSVISQQDLLGTLSTAINTFTAFLASIAGISLLVGGIGIMNMMLTTVTERTREIGLRKAIGAKNKDIHMQFLFESLTLTIIGGIFGVILGIAIALIISLTGIVSAEVGLPSILLSFGVSAVIGVAFGYYPAARAASLNPIEALRYE